MSTVHVKFVGLFISHIWENLVQEITYQYFLINMSKDFSDWLLSNHTVPHYIPYYRTDIIYLTNK